MPRMARIHAVGRTSFVLISAATNAVVSMGPNDIGQLSALAHRLLTKPVMLNRAIVVAAACWLGACQFDEGPDQVLPVTVPPAPGGTGGAGGAAGPDGGFSATGGRAVQPPAPAGPWMEHWFEHNQFLNVVDEDENIVLYFDDAVNLASKTWLSPYLSRLWAYAKATYGAPGDPRLYAVFHTGRYGGAHSASLFDSTHDFRNVIDCGSATDVWSNPDSAEIPTGIAGTLLVLAPYGVESDPAIALSGYHFTEIFNYDALKMLGMPEVASRVLASNLASTSDSPRVDTHWFRDWYYPLWQQSGAAVFGRYFQLL
jgi:hypothetical protein